MALNKHKELLNGNFTFLIKTFKCIQFMIQFLEVIANYSMMAEMNEDEKDHQVSL